MPDGYSGNSLQDWLDQQSNPAAPKGLRQAAAAGEGYNQKDPGFAESGLGAFVNEHGYQGTNYAWYTGANTGTLGKEGSGLDNGWDNGFRAMAVKQYTETLEKYAENPRAFEDWLNSGTATGVVTWGERRKEGDGDEAHFGDVWKNGKRVGNVYDDYNEKDANVLISDWVLDSKTKNKVFADDNRDAWLADEIEKARKQATDQLTQGVTAREFQGKVDREQVELEKKGVGNWLAAGAAFLGGGLAAGAAFFTGGATAPVAAGLFTLGAGIAGGTAYMNKDQLTELSARAIVTSREADEKFGGFQGFTAGLSGWSQVGMRLINPVSNGVQGLADLQYGGGPGIQTDKAGNEFISEGFYAVDENGERKAGGLWTAGDVLGTVADSVLQFSNPVGLALYSTAMTGTIVGEVGTLGTTGESFNMRSGQFEDHEGFKQNAAAWMNVGIDAVQLGMARGIGNAARSARAAIPGAAATERQAIAALRQPTPFAQTRAKVRGALPHWAGGVKEGERAVTVAGSRYVLNAEGQAVYRGFSLAALAPSEFTQRAAASLKYRVGTTVSQRQASKELGTIADDYYRAAVAVTSGQSSRFAAAMLNGFGEGAEEAAQAVLEPISHSERIDVQEVARSFMYGAAAGVGMGLGATMGGPSSTQKLYGRFLAKGLLNEESMPFEVFADLPLDQQRALAKMSDADVQKTQGAVDAFTKSLNIKTLKTGALGYYAMTTAVDTEFGRIAATANNAMTSVLKINAFSNPDVTDERGELGPVTAPVYAAELSAWRVAQEIGKNVDQYRNFVTTLQRDLAEANLLPATEEAEVLQRDKRVAELTEQLADAQLAFDLGRNVAVEIRQAYELFDQAIKAKDGAAAEAALSQMDAQIEAYYLGTFEVDGVEASEEMKRAARDAVSVLYARDPNISEGSFALLMPRVSRALTIANQHGVIEVHQSLIKAPNADHDGDNLRSRRDLMLDRRSRDRLRYGAQYLSHGEEGKVKVVIAAPDSEPGMLKLARWAGESSRPEVVAALESEISQLQEIFWSKISPAVRNQSRLVDALETLGTDIKAGKETARNDFLDTVATAYERELTQISREQGYPIWTWMSQQITAKLDAIQIAYSSTQPEYDYVDSATGEQVADDLIVSKFVSERSLRQAATLGATLQMLTPGTSVVRGEQGLHYSWFNSAVELVESDATLAPDLMQRLTEFYEGRSSGAARSSAEEILNRDAVTRGVLADLEAILEEGQVDLGSNKTQALLKLGMTRVQDFDFDNGILVPVNRDVTVIQVLLRRRVAQERAAYAGVMDKNPDVERRLNLLEAMTWPKNDGRGHHLPAQEAAFEVFADVPLYSLLGQDAMFVGMNQTMRGLVRQVIDLDDVGRRNLLAKWKRKAPYFGRINRNDPPYSWGEMTAGDLSGYRVAIDMVSAIANQQEPLRHERSENVIASFESGIADLQGAVDNWMQLLTAENRAQVSELPLAERVLAMVNSNPQMARTVANMLPQAVKLGAFVLNEDNSVYAAEWVTDMLGMKPNQAVFSYWLHTTFSDYLMADQLSNAEEAAEAITRQHAEDVDAVKRGDTSMRTYARLQSNASRMIYRMASDPTGMTLLSFIRKANEALALDDIDLRDFVKDTLNTSRYKGDRTDVTPFVDDVAETDTSFERSWQPKYPGAQLREAISAFETSASIYSEQIAHAVAVKNSDTTVANSIAAYIKSLNDPTISVETDAKTLTLQLARMVENAQEIWTSAGPTAIDNAAAVMQTGLHIDHNKGAADPDVAPLGEARVLSEGGGAKTSLMRAFDDVTAISEQTVMQNPRMLAHHSFTIRLDNGAEIDWIAPQFTESGHAVTGARQDLASYARLLADPRTAGFVKQVLGLTVKDISATGQLNTVRYRGRSQALQHSLLEQLETSSLSHLFPREGEQLSPQAALEYISLVEGAVFKRVSGKDAGRQTRGFYPLQRMIHEVVTAYTHSLKTPLSQASQAAEIRDYAYVAVARTVQLMADQHGQSPARMELVKAELQDSLRKRFGQPAVNTIAQTFDQRAELLLSLARSRMDAATRRYEELTGRIRSAASDQEAMALLDEQARLADEIEAYTKDLELELSGTTVDAVLAMFSVNQYDPATAAVQKKALLEYLGSGGRINYFTDDTLTVWNEVLDALNSREYQLTGEAELSPEAWEIVSRAAATSFLSERARLAGTQVSLKLLEGTAGEWRDVARYFDSTWSFLIDFALTDDVLDAAQYIAGKAAYTTTGQRDVTDIAKEIERTLFNEKRLGKWSAPVVRLNVGNRDTLLSSAVGVAVAIPGNLPNDLVTLRNATERSYDLPVDEPTTQSFHLSTIESPIFRHLTEGHFYRREGGAQFVYTDSEGVQQSYDLFQNGELGQAWGSLDDADQAAVFNSGYVVTSYARMLEALNQALTITGAKDGEIVLTGFDPRRRPEGPRWAHNVFYSGVGREGVVGNSDSLISETVFSTDGIYQTLTQKPLDAIKNAIAAFTPTTRIPYSLSRNLKADTYGKLIAKARLVMDREYDFGQLHASDLNMVMEIMRVRHVVRGVDEAGNTVIWSVDRQVAAEQRGEGLADPQLIALTEEQTNTVLGSTNGKSTQVAGLDIDQRAVSSFTEITEEALVAAGITRLGESATIAESQFQYWTPLSTVSSPMTRDTQKVADFLPRITRWQNTRDQVFQDRLESRFDPAVPVRANQATLDQALTFEAIASQMAAVAPNAFGGSQESQRALADAVLQSIVKRLEMSASNTLFVYEQGGTGSPTEGVLTESSLSEKNPNPPVLGDGVVVKLDAFEAQGLPYDETLKMAEGAIRQLARNGASIHLVNASGARQLRTDLREFLENELGYEGLSSHSFVPVLDRSYLTATDRAMEATLLETRDVSPLRLQLEFRSHRFTQANENQSHWNIPEGEAAPKWWVMRSNILSARPEGFSEPVNDEQRAVVRQRLLDAFNDKETWQQLLVQAGKGDEIATYLSKLGGQLQAGKWPKDVGETFGFKHFDVLVGPGDTIYLARQGFKAMTTKEVLAAAGDLGIVVGQSERDESLTTNVGEVMPDPMAPKSSVNVRMPSNLGGGRVNLRIDISTIGAKGIGEKDGMKHGFVNMPADLAFPTAEVTPGWSIGIGSGVKAGHSKEALYGVVNNFRNAFLVFGADFREDMIEFITGSRPTRENFDAKWAVTEATLLAIQNSEVQLTPAQTAAALRGDSFLSMYGTVLSNYLVNELGMEQANVEWATSAVPQSVNQRLGTVFVAALMTKGVRLEHLLGTQGMVDMESSDVDRARIMPAIFTDSLDDYRYPELRKMLFDRINAKMPKALEGGGRDYTLQPNWDFVVKMKRNGQDDYFVGELKLTDLILDDAHPDLQVQSEASNTTDAVSLFAAAQASVLFSGGIAHRKDFDRIRDIIDGNLAMSFDSDGALFARLRNISNVDVPSMERTDAERDWVEDALKRHALYYQDIDKTDWTDTDKERYAQRARAVAGTLFNQARSVDLVDALVRMYIGARGIDTSAINEVEGVDSIPSNVAFEVLAIIEQNLEEHLFPLHGSTANPLLDADMIEMIFNANQSSKSQKWAPAVSKGGRRTVYAKDDITSWIHAAFGQMAESDATFEPAFRLDLDGAWATFSNYTDAIGELPPSVSPAVNLKLLNQDSQVLASSLDPLTKEQLTSILGLDGTSMDLESFLTRSTTYDRGVGESVSASAISARLERVKEWKTKNKVGHTKPGKVKDYLSDGAWYSKRATGTHKILRGMTNLRLGMSLFNPALMIAAIPEAQMRNSLDGFASVLQGTSFGAVGRMAARTGKARYTAEQVKQANNLIEFLGNNPEFMAMIYDELMYAHQVEPGDGRLGIALEKFARMGSRLQDPTWGMFARTVAKRYVESALAYLEFDADNVITFDRFIAEMRDNPKFLQEMSPRGSNNNPMRGLSAQSSALNAVAQIRSTRANVVGKALRGVYEPLAESGGTVRNVAGHLLKWPMIFGNYTAGAAMFLTGTGGIGDWVAAELHGRSNGPIGRIQAAMRGVEYNETTDSTFDMSDVLDGIDLTRSFLRSGITWSGYMGYLLMGGSGLSGEDKEAKRRRLLATYYGAPLQYDPLAIQNDFRNGPLVFLDGLPGPLKSMATVFSRPAGENTVTAMAPHWIIRQFVSPLVGMERFMSTGDLRQITWGFDDAVSAIPISVTRVISDWKDAAEELRNMAEAEARVGTEDSMRRTNEFIIGFVGMYERMMLESSFINTVRNGADKYDRDPWVNVKTDEHGNVIKDSMGNPVPLDTVVKTTDEEGNVIDVYQGRDYWDAQLHQYAENNATFSFLANLFTGHLPGGDGSYSRGNMAVKQKSVELKSLTEEQAAGMFLKAFDFEGGAQEITAQEAQGLFREKGFDYQTATELALSVEDQAGNEVLTEFGARRIFDSIYKGAVDFDSGSLAGIYVTREMRDAVAVKLFEEIVQEGIQWGMNEVGAKYRAKRIWYGHTEEEPDKLGLRDIIYSDQIAQFPTQKYNQLNTTFVLGPDGKPYATGIKRDGWLEALGINFVGKGLIANTDGGMDTDVRMNSVDVVRGVNTGLRALERNDAEKIEPNDEVIDKVMAKTFPAAKNSGTGGYKRGGYGGGYSSYGGGGYFTRMNRLPEQRAVYGNSIPFLNTSNPIIRRADVRRERVWSERGRLKQWQ